MENKKKEEKHYRVNTKTKTIIIEPDKLTKGELNIVTAYLGAGYTHRVKTSSKGNGLTKDEIRNGLIERKLDKEIKELEKKLEEKTNFMKICRWYRYVLECDDMRKALKESKLEKELEELNNKIETLKTKKDDEEKKYMEDIRKWFEKTKKESK